MLLLRVLELCVLAFAVALVATQVVGPLMQGTRLFPALRARGRAERELAGARDDLAAETVEEEARRVRDEIVARRARRTTQGEADGTRTDTK